MKKKLRVDPSAPVRVQTKKERQTAAREHAAERAAKRDAWEFAARVSPPRPGIKDLPRAPRRRKNGKVLVYTREQIAEWEKSQGSSLA